MTTGVQGLDIRLREVERRLRALEEIRFEPRRNPAADAIMVLAKEDGGTWTMQGMLARLRERYPRTCGYSGSGLYWLLYRLVASGELQRVDRGVYKATSSAAVRPRPVVQHAYPTCPRCESRAVRRRDFPGDEAYCVSCGWVEYSGSATG